jgi:hypothetical protein
MYYNHLLRTNLQEWRNRLYKSDSSDFKDDFIFFWSKIEQEPYLLGILEETTAKYHLETNDLEQWFKQYSRDTTIYQNDKHKLSYFIYLCRYFFSKKDIPTNYGIFGGKTFKDSNQSFLDRMITPIVNYLHDCLDEVNNILYFIEKYKLRTEWFCKDILKEKYRNAANKQYEQVFEDDIRLYLFDQGIKYPFSTPKSASGRADVVSLIDTDDPLVMEIKVLDSEKNYKKDRIIIGFTQIVKYSNDYHKKVGYLVVFNLDNVEIEIENKETENRFPNRIIFNGKTYYIIIVNLNYDVSASKQKTLNSQSLKRD